MHIAALEKDWHGTDSMLGFYLEKHEVDFEVTFVDGDPTWEVAIGGQDEEEVGGALKLPVVVLGRDVWWGETKVRKIPPLTSQSCPAPYHTEESPRESPISRFQRCQETLKF